MTAGLGYETVASSPGPQGAGASGVGCGSGEVRVARPGAERMVRRALGVPDSARPGPLDVHRAFSLSIVLSGLRCLFGYVVAPFALPAAGVAATPGLGLLLSAIAIAFDVRAVRRFWIVDHPRRWGMTGLYAIVVTFVLVVFAADLSSLVG